MAFTIAHMAAALPFYRRQKWFHFEALLIGTILPDLPYILNDDRAVAQQSHQWLGLLTYCLPWGLFAFVLWHWLFKAAAVALIQPWHSVQRVASDDLNQGKVNPQFYFRFRPFGYFWLTVVLGLTLGASTHLLWDGITHPDGFIAQKINWLQYPLEIVGLGEMPVARLLQYVSSIIGLIVLTIFAWHRFKSLTCKTSSSDTPYMVFSQWQSLLIIMLVTLCSLYYGLYAAVQWQSLIPSYYYFMAKVLVGLMQGAGGAFMLYAVLYCLLSRFKKIERHC